ncbi:sensor histidine kinase KdpD [Flavonifractor plautii]|uniref:sensor histidine kinase n=1 Tax=Flavonifractor plautii TaxID=292800 RepID=UPI001D020076|nr:sensor histidine kinase KdpD [Flavonifractor plautii]MCB5856154.1 sensor histidine kinase KdpD [Flavonifractor plautii]
MTDQRPDPDALLRELKLKEETRTGKLKIFFGYAAGVGKTYAMLEAAHHAKEMGVDVVAGYIEPHVRPETLALLDGLEQLPNKEIPYKNITLREFDLDGALARKPQLILVDELAHTNAAGSRHRKRYQDIKELLRAGISVYTTVNVQHLESLNDVVASITGIAVAERLPDRIFDRADQVEVVDIEPADLLERLKEGKIYRPNQAARAMDHFFTLKNLAALREIALRRTADRLNRAADTGVGTKAKSSEHILVCLSGAPSNANVIRTAARMAEAFRSSFTALFVETSDFKDMSDDNRSRLRANLRLAEELGARIATVYGDDTPLQIAEYARASGVTKIVLGRSNNKRFFWERSKNLVDRLNALAPDLDIHIIPDTYPAYRAPRKSWNLSERFTVKDALRTLVILAVCTMVGLAFAYLDFSEANIIMIYQLGVLVVAMVTSGRLYSLAASILSILIFNFFFTVPLFTLHFNDKSYLATFLVMFLVAFLSSSLTTRIKRQARLASRQAYRTQVLLEASQTLQKAEGQEAILEAMAVQLRKLLERTALYYPVLPDGTLGQPRFFPVEPTVDTGAYLGPDETAVASWVQKNNKHAGATTNTLPNAKCLYLAVRGEGSALAVAGIAIEEGREPDAFEKNLMLAIVDECGLVLEKELLGQEKHRVEEQAQQEALRANLLRAISHDLRTPLTAISGNAGILMENASVLDAAKRRQLYTSIYDDSMWLANLVENLLSVSRIENGTIRLKMEPELLEEVFQEALTHLDRKAKEHTITVELPDDMLMAKMDARLIVQVVINIVNNAIKYTPPGSHVQVSARKRGESVEVRIADDGPGISDEAKAKLFDMFYTANNARGDGRRGLGLGLSLCRSIVQAHGGSITVEDNYPKGAIFSFTLPLAEVNTDEQTSNLDH